MSADAKTTTSLLYVADEGTNTVDVFSYPQGKLKGQLTGFNIPSGMCSDRAGNVYIENGNAYTVEVYAHGGTVPLRTLSLPGYPQLNCTVDPVTQNVALGAFDGSCGGCIGYIAIFTGGQGMPTLYQPSTGNPLHEQQGIPGCGYDTKGNLFCDAYIGPSGQNFGLFELPKGRKTVTEITVSGANFRAGAAQWDGSHIDVNASSYGTLYQIAVSGSTGTVVGSTVLETGAWVWQFLITQQDTRVVAPVSYGSTEYVGYWNYPAGGTPTKAIQGFTQVDGATVSTIK
jgi:ribosomal protein L21E